MNTDTKIDEVVNYTELVAGDFKAEDGVFAIAYLSPEDISVTKRIRKSADAGSLVRSIRDVGLLKPITVAPVGEDCYVLVDGLRRLNACIEAGMSKIPCIVGKSVKTSDIPVMASVYNHAQPYSNAEVSAYVDYLMNEREIHDYNNIEYLLQLETGEVAKLQDLKSDNDPEIMGKFMGEELSIGAAFKKLEARRKKESKAEKLARQAEKAYETGEGLSEAGERGTISETDFGDEPARKPFNPGELDENIDDKPLDAMVAESDATVGFKPNKQKVGKRERIEPSIKKATLARDNYTCQCCKRGGESYVDSLDYHHIMPVALGGDDSVSNGVTLCVLCHRFVHLFGNGQLTVPMGKTDEDLTVLSAEERAIYDDDQRKFKRIVKLGQLIRDGYAKQGIDRKKAREMFPVDGVGRHKPSENLNSKELGLADFGGV